MTAESLTYSQLGERLSCSPEAARSLSRRLRLVRKPGNDGRVRVIADGPRADIDALKAQIEQLQSDLAKLETEKNCLEASVAEHRADFEHERDRCDRLIAETLVLNKVAMSAREAAARLEGEASGRRNHQPWWGRLIPPRKHRLAGTSPAAIRPPPLPAIKLAAGV